MDECGRRKVLDLFCGAYPDVDLVVCRLDGSFFAVSHRDTVIGTQILNGIPFEKDNFDRAVALIAEHGYVEKARGRCFVDVGANIGTMTIYAHRTGIFDGFLCFEPEPLNFRILEINRVLNDIPDCRPFRLALGDRAGSASFELAADNFGDHRVRVGDNAADGPYAEASRSTIAVPMMTPDAVLREQHIDASRLGWIWIDTQGYEGFVLEGARAIRDGAVLTVSEFWPYGMRRAESWPAFRRCAREYFASFHDLDETPCARRDIEDLDGLYDRLVDGTGHTDLLLVPR